MAVCEHNVATLANNHILDAGVEGLRTTLKTLRANDILPVGAGINETEASAPLELEVRRLRLGIANYNLVGWETPLGLLDVHGARKGKPGAARFDIRKSCNRIQALSEQVDYVIVALHMGRVGESSLRTRDVDIVRRVVDAGADLVVVHHSHMMSGLMLHAGKPILLGLGELVFDPELRDPSLPGEFVLPLVDLADNGSHLRICPVSISRYGVPSVADTEISERTADRFVAMSKGESKFDKS